MAEAPGTVTLDVFLLTVTIPRDRPAAELAKARRTLNRLPFRAALQVAVGDVVRRFPTLAAVTVTVAR